MRRRLIIPGLALVGAALVQRALGSRPTVIEVRVAEEPTLSATWRAGG